MYVQNIVIECTRRCNSDSCSHCLRGEPEPIDMPYTLLPNIFYNISVGTLTLTGGEITMASKFLNMFKQYLIYHKVDIYNFYIKTNGKIKSRSLVSLCDYLSDMVCDSSSCTLALSMDEFHDDIGHENLKFWCDVRETREYSVYFDKHRYNIDSLIKEGRWGSAVRGRDTRERLRSTEFTLSDNRKSLDATIYVNALGKVTIDCDLSYETQKKLIIGDIRERKLVDILCDPKTEELVLKIKGKAEEWCKKYGIK